jgi:hypothetical protein
MSLEISRNFPKSPSGFPDMTWHAFLMQSTTIGTKGMEFEGLFSKMCVTVVIA